MMWGWFLLIFAFVASTGCSSENCLTVEEMALCFTSQETILDEKELAG